MNVVSGARVTRGGLHLGHFLGCFQKLITMKDQIDNYFFVLNDKPSPTHDADFIMLLTDIYSIKFAYGLDQLHTVLDTDLMLENASFLSFLRNNVTLPKLLEIYPKNERGTYNGSNVSDFLFPIEQAATYFLFDAAYAFLNDDNLRFVTFAAELAKKVNNLQDQVDIRIPRLMTGRIPHLCGYNYKKMSKANANTIPLSDSQSDISSKLYKLFDMKTLFQKYPSEKGNFDRAYPYIFPPEFLPFQYIRAFFDMDEQFDYDILKDSTKREYFRTIFIEKILDMLSPIWQIRKKLYPCDVLEFYHLDNQLSRDSVNKELNNIKVV